MSRIGSCPRLTGRKRPEAIVSLEFYSLTRSSESALHCITGAALWLCTGLQHGAASARDPILLPLVRQNSMLHINTA